MQVQNPTEVLVGVTDDLDPELQAMLLAKYSRSYGSIVGRLPTSQEDETKLKARLREVYLNYGHRSVGQLGYTTIFFEGVSMLAAIAIEVSELFNGQESSTRYIDYGNQPAVGGDLCDNRKYQERWRQLYMRAMAEITDTLKQQYPINPGDDPKVYNNTIKAKAFDICGGLLPAGFTTCVGFVGNFDVLNEHLGWMLYHPLEEVRDLAKMAIEALCAKYPDGGYSLEKQQRYNEYRQYGQRMSNNHVDSYYYRRNANLDQGVNKVCDRHVFIPGLKKREYELALEQGYQLADGLKQTWENRLMLQVNFWSEDQASDSFGLRDLLVKLGSQERQCWQQFPKSINAAVSFKVNSMMDFRSYRDLHRHRNGQRPLPLLDIQRIIHPYYTAQFSQTLQEEIEQLCADQQSQREREQRLAVTEAERNTLLVNGQYSTPMGVLVPYYYICGLNQLLYLMERRTPKDVHQTLRIEMLSLYAQFHAMFPQVKVHVDTSPTNFTLKRGTQTFSDTPV